MDDEILRSFSSRGSLALDTVRPVQWRAARLACRHNGGLALLPSSSHGRIGGMRMQMRGAHAGGDFDALPGEVGLSWV